MTERTSQKKTGKKSNMFRSLFAWIRKLTVSTLRLFRPAPPDQGWIRSFQEIAQLGTLDWLPGSETITLSPETSQMFGLRKTQTIKLEHLLTLVHRRDRDQFRGWLEQADNESRVQEAQFRIIHANRTIHWMEIMLRRLALDTVQTGHVVGLIRNITDRKRLEQRTAAEHAVARVLAESAELDDSAIKVLQSLCDVFDCSVGELWLPEGDHLACKNQYVSEDHETFTEWETVTTRLRPTLGEGLIGGVWFNKEPRWAEDFGNSDFFRGPLAKRLNIYSAFALPMLIGARCYGVIACFSRFCQPSDPQLLSVTAEIGRILGEFIRRTQAEAALRESENRYRHLVSLMPAALYMIDASGQLTFYNQHAAELWGREPRLNSPEDMYTGCYQLLNPDGSVFPKADGPMARAIKYGKSVRNEEWYFAQPAGKRLIGSVNVDPILSQSGNVVGAINVFEDITARKQAEQALRESEQRLRQLADSMPQLVWSALPNGKIDYMNKRHSEFLGIERLPDGSWNWAPALHPDDRQQTLQRWRESLRTGNDYQGCHRMQNAGGAYRWHLCRAVASRDDQGQVLRWFATATDIHDQKETEQALKKSEERLALAQHAATTGIFDWTCTEDKMWWSPEMYEVWGLPIGSISTLSQTIDAADPRDQKRLKGAFAEVFASHKEDWNEEFQITHSTKGPRWLSSIGKIAYDDQGQPLRMSGVIIDVTARKEAEEKLKESDRRKEEFLAMLGHELRNPLAAIRSGLSVWKRAQSPERVTWVQQVIERQTLQLQRIIDDLLDISRITRGRLILKKEETDLGEIVHSAVAAVTSMFEQRNHKLRISLSPEHINLTADPARIEQILVNLLNNAAKYTDPGGEILLSVKERPDDVQIQVQDNGVGLAPDTISHAFEMFSQLNTTPDRSTGGLGLGLTLVKGIVTLHGGNVWAESKGLRQGSLFTVTLPKRPLQEATEPEITGEKATIEVSDRKRVLIVDDNRDLATNLRIFLEDAGYETKVAHDGEQALAVAKAFQPGVMLLDIGLPILTGLEVAKRLRAGSVHNTETKIIGISGYGQEKDKEQSKQAGFDYHLVKPLDHNELLQLIGAP